MTAEGTDEVGEILQRATPVSDSDWSPAELDLAVLTTDVLVRAQADGDVAWVTPDGQVAFKATIPDKYVEGTDLTREDFIPNADVAAACRDAIEHADEYGMPNPDSQREGITRAHQLVDHYENDEPLAPDYWVEIDNFHGRHRAQDNHECDESEYDPCMADPGVFSDHTWGSDAAVDQAERIVGVMDEADGTESEADTDEMPDNLEMKGPAATVADQPEALTNIHKQGTNEIDPDALPDEYQQALEAEDFIIYGKASIEQWDDDDVPTKIQMDALEDALDRFFESDNAPGIISRGHQDIPVGRPVREHTLDEALTLELETPDGEPETHEFEAGETLTTHVADADGDDQQELWLLSNLANDTEPAKQARLEALEGNLNGYSVTIHRNRDEVTQDGRIVTKCDLHAVTLGRDDQIKNAGSTFDVAEFKAAVRDRMDLAEEKINNLATAVTTALH